MGKKLIQDEVAEYTCDCCGWPIGRLSQAVKVDLLDQVELWDEWLFCRAACFLRFVSTELEQGFLHSSVDYVLRLRGSDMVEVVKALKVDQGGQNVVDRVDA